VENCHNIEPYLPVPYFVYHGRVRVRVRVRVMSTYMRVATSSNRVDIIHALLKVVEPTDQLMYSDFRRLGLTCYS